METEISDYNDYETITPIRKAMKMKKNLCNHSFEFSVIKRA
jgi:hypothetical protein